MITTNDGQGHSGPMSGLNAYSIGLYVGSLNTHEDSLTLVSVAVNAPVPGRFVGNNVLPLPAPWGGINQTLTFQVRAWSYGGGASYEEAMAGGWAWLGKSALGTVAPTFSPYPAPLLFVLGSDLGIIDGFEIRPPSASYNIGSVPEPSTYALGGIALLCVALFQRKRSVGRNHLNR